MCCFGRVEGLGWYLENEKARVVAPSNFTVNETTAYIFEGWYEGGKIVSTIPEYTFIVSRPAELTAVYVEERTPVAPHDEERVVQQDQRLVVVAAVVVVAVCLFAIFLLLLGEYARHLKEFLNVNPSIRSLWRLREQYSLGFLGGRLVSYGGYPA